MVVELGDKAAKAVPQVHDCVSTFWTDIPQNIQPCGETKEVF